MKDFIKFSVAVVLFIAANNCGQASETAISNISDGREPQAAAGGSSANAENSAANSNQNTYFLTHPAFANADANSSSNAAAMPGGETKVVKIEPKNFQPISPATPASDNSEISSVLGEKGTIETRVFKNNPTLAKIERISNGAQDQRAKIKVFLKNGKVFELPAEKIGDFVNAPAQQILRAVGIEPKFPPPPQQSKPSSSDHSATGAKTAETGSEMKKSASESPTKKNP
jgi:hypothetical protein